MIKIVIGLISVMLANVLLGVTLAKLKQEFKKEKLLSGLVKYLGIVLGVLLMYLAGYLNPNIIDLSYKNNSFIYISTVIIFSIYRFYQGLIVP